jgi:tRNA threonylcarbamoyladenosine biosynthesis protein TsaE
VKLADEAATEALGALLARAVPRPRFTPLIVYLEGDLGTGKTTLVRGLLRALGVDGTIRSPSYTLVEPYEAAGVSMLHVDLYRLRTANEVLELGLSELSPHGLLLVEWPERGQPHLPAADLIIRLSHDGAARSVRVDARSAAGVRWLQNVKSLDNISIDN